MLSVSASSARSAAILSRSAVRSTIVARGLPYNIKQLCLLGPSASCRLRCLTFRHVERHARQLQYRRPLTLQETCEGHDRAVGEFERVMVSESDIQINLPKPCDITRRRMLPVRYRVLVARRGIECEFRARPKAYSRVEVSSSGKASCDGIMEVGRDQAIGDRSRPRCHVFETVIAHDTLLYCSCPHPPIKR